MEEAEILEIALSHFCCEKNLDVQEFLHSKAAEFERRDLGRTYLIIEDDLTSLEGHIVILGYFTLAMKALILHPNISKEIKKKIANDKTAEIATGYLIGQLGKNDKYKEYIKGEEILNSAIELITNLHTKLAGRFLYVECEDTKKLVSFYEHNSFKIVQKGEMVQLYRRLRS
jgi:hypothetical protein